MILGFSTQLNGKPTYFVEKIHAGLVKTDLFQGHIKISFDHSDFNVDMFWNCTPKLHTIREDKNDRWKVGTKIDFFINCRQKNMFRFAPVLPVVSIQKVEIVYYTNREIIMNDLPPKKVVIIDDKKRLNFQEIETLALNDGFDNVEDFFAYFENGFTGKIIHWTGLKY